MDVFYCICRLVFEKSNDSGRSMGILSKGPMNGVDTLKEFTSPGGKKKKGYFYLDLNYSGKLT